jgi:hypothetical protein
MGKKNSSKVGHGGYGPSTPVAPTGGRVPGEEFLTASRGTPRAVSPTAVGGMPPKVGNMMAPQNTNTGRMKVPEVGSGTVAGVVPTMRATTPKPTALVPLPNQRPRVGSGRMRSYIDHLQGRHPFVTNHGHGMSNCNYAGRDEE